MMDTDPVSSQTSQQEVGQSSSSADVPASQREQAAAMLEFSISYNGRNYFYNGHRYDRFSDAHEYAKLMRSQPSKQDVPGPFRSDEILTSLSQADRELMTLLGISFEAGGYRFAGFRYDHLADAVNYARSR